MSLYILESNVNMKSVRAAYHRSFASVCVAWDVKSLLTSLVRARHRGSWTDSERSHDDGDSDSDSTVTAIVKQKLNFFRSGGGL